LASCTRELCLTQCHCQGVQGLVEGIEGLVEGIENSQACLPVVHSACPGCKQVAVDEQTHTSFSWRMKSAREPVSSGRQINMLRLHDVEPLRKPLRTESGKWSCTKSHHLQGMQ
jgi:hypothetical protein